MPTPPPPGQLQSHSKAPAVRQQTQQVPDTAKGQMLAQIMQRKRREVARRRGRRPMRTVVQLAERQLPARDFLAALAVPGLSLIAEIKKASPSRGLIRADFHPADHAIAYAAGGAACLSVLTDEAGFRGDDVHLQAARAACDLPILRKDFMWDPYQVVEARALGADAILIIMAVVDDDRARDLFDTAREWNMTVLVEVHDAHELQRAIALGARLIGVNNRDLRSFETRLDTFETLAPQAPPGTVLVAESGIATPQDAARMHAAGANAILVGESLMRQPDLTAATQHLLGC